MSLRQSSASWSVATGSRSGNSLPGESQIQRVLQYPVCLIVVASDYARFYGVVQGLSTVELKGSAWAVGVMLQPAAGRLLWGRSVSTLTDRHVSLESVSSIDGADLRDRIRKIITPDPAGVSSHLEAIGLIENALVTFTPIDEDGRAINSVVSTVETDRDVVRVDQLASLTGIGERTLQRLTRDRLGLTPKWLIQRRRLHDAVEQIKSGDCRLTELAYRLGYADQAHFTRDFVRVTGATPGAYQADQAV